MKRTTLPVSEGPGSTKIHRVVNYITEAIGSREFAEGEQLPSINEISRQSGFSRDTVAKAYGILKERGAVEPVPAKGYFVKRPSLRILMLLDDFSAFKEQLYNTFRANLPGLWRVDLLFHHYNEPVFRQLIQNSLGRYSKYVVMNLNNRELHPVLKQIDPSRLLLLDMGTNDLPEVNFLLQNFDEAVERCLEQGIALMKKYREIVLVYSRRDTPHPPEIREALGRFCRNHGFGFRVVPDAVAIEPSSGQAFVVIRECDLVAIVKACGKSSLSLGREVGVLAYNDTPMKEIAGNGITTLSVNFNEMGEKAAKFVAEGQKIAEYLPTSLTIRHSL